MVMADHQELEPPPIDHDHAVPLDEVLGEAEARFGPMPACIRSILLPVGPTTSSPIATSPKSSPESTCVDSLNSSVNSNKVDVTLGTPDEDRSNEGKGETRTKYESTSGEGGISLNDISFIPSSLMPRPSLGDANDDDDANGKQTLADDIFLDLEDDHESAARRSPDSGCSMSEVSAEDKVSIASTVSSSSSSDDFGGSRLDKQIQRLRHAMTELREQDVALARQLLIVYDYVEETKWFLENFEACDPRHSIASPMTSTERRFSQNFHKRLSDFGIAYMKGISNAGFATPPSWTELNGGVGTMPKRHSRNISDGMISVEQLRRIYHENNNNNSGDIGDHGEEGKSFGSCDLSGLNDNLSSDGCVGKQRSPRSMTRRSISSNFLEIGLSSMSTTSKGDQSRHQRCLSPISDTAKALPGLGDNDQQLASPHHGRDQDRDGPDESVIDGERTSVVETVSCSKSVNERSSVSSSSTASHQRGSTSSSSASSMMSVKSYTSTSSSSSSTDSSTKASSTSTKAMTLSTQESLDSIADDTCSIFIADDSANDVLHDDPIAMSPFDCHMHWLQEQDETLL